MADVLPFVVCTITTLVLWEWRMMWSVTQVIALRIRRPKDWRAALQRLAQERRDRDDARALLRYCATRFHAIAGAQSLAPAKRIAEKALTELEGKA
jgi:hypothetical protein